MKSLCQFKGHQVFDYITPHLSSPSPLIIEAGAFDGTDTIAMANKWPHSIIHAFEPVPALYKTLCNNTEKYSNIFCHQLALSNKNGMALFYVSEKPDKPGIISQAGSLLAPKERLAYSPIRFPYTIMVPTITLDAWAEHYNISSVDFIWLDIQGHEMAVLQASQFIESVKALYLEVGFLENYEGQPTYDVIKNWLTKKEFKEIGSDFSNTHDWIFGNVLFARP